MVRREVRLALAGQVRLVPLLLDDTRMPRATELPPDLKALSSVNAFSLRTAHFDEDMDALLDALLGNKQGRGSRWWLDAAADVARHVRGDARRGAPDRAADQPVTRSRAAIGA